jgi:DUF4097 and DUF4098 domain-containing protein YvlB
VSKVKARIQVLLLGALLATAARSEDVDKTLDAAPDGQVDISNTAGSIEVEGWSKNSVQVRGELGSNVEELIFERDKDVVTVKVKVPRSSSRGISSDIHVKVPQKSSIEVTGVSADITVQGVHGAQNLHSVSGDVSTEAFGGDVEIGSVSGDVSIDGNDKDIDVNANTVSGDVMLKDLAGEVKAEAVSGDLTLNGGSFDRAELQTVNGDLIFKAELRKGGRLSGESVNGDVTIEFASKVSAKFDVESFNGDIDNCFGPEAQRTSKYAPGLELRFTEGDGAGTVSVSTLNGDIDICNR